MEDPDIDGICIMRECIAEEVSFDCCNIFNVHSTKCVWVLIRIFPSPLGPRSL